MKQNEKKETKLRVFKTTYPENKTKDFNEWTRHIYRQIEAGKKNILTPKN